MPPSEFAGDALDEDFGIGFDKDGHRIVEI
jgi:hypothetical protein